MPTPLVTLRTGVNRSARVANVFVAPAPDDASKRAGRGGGGGVGGAGGALGGAAAAAARCSARRGPHWASRALRPAAMRSR